MSALTKLFVILLIVCSMLLTAATVVFVNRTEDFRNQALLSDKATKKVEKELADTRSELASTQQRELRAVTDGNNRASDLQTKITGLEKDIATRDGNINDLKQQLAIAQANISTGQGAMAQMQQTINNITDRNKTLVEENDKTRQINADLIARNTHLDKQLAEAERERRFLVEREASLRAQVDKLNKIVIDNRLQLVEKPLRIAAPAINGVIRNVARREGIAYAEISVGAADKVTRGMQFSVVDPVSKQFLGFLTVQTVEQNAAMGQLEGPRVDEVKPDNQVFTQF